MTPEERGALMARIRSRDTTPEIEVRRALHAAGLRFRLNRKDLPGKPDIVLGGRRAAVFVHGCYWHQHGCTLGHVPRSRLEYWGPKLRRNRERDAAAQAALREAGWHVEVVWECQVRAGDLGGLIDRLSALPRRRR
jgi:DNA mismatch endonuclease (patch repair protein)